MRKSNDILSGSIILVTGGTGSFGNEAVKHFLKHGAKEVRILSRDEKKQFDMRTRFNNKKLNFFIGDIRNERSMDNAMEDVDFVFHAAALKQVPSCEFFPIETIATNALGTENVISCAQRHKVKKVVVLSTDKAVSPVNVMGMTKALAEKIMAAHARRTDGKKNKTIVCATRYGNVMATRGSVIPFFIEQIKNSHPITVTDPSMTRFMLELTDAIDLVLFALKDAKGGEIYVKKSPASTVGDVALALKALYNSKSKIKNVGIRLGEKVHETLISPSEMARAVEFKDYFRIALDTKELSYDRYFSKGQKKPEILSYTSDNAERLNLEGTMTLLSKLDIVKKEAIKEETKKK